MRSKKIRETHPKFLLQTGVCLALTGAGIIPAQATCSQAGTNVTCSGVASPLTPDFSSNLNNINVTVNPGASLGVLLGVGGTAMKLTGNNVTLTNNGLIDPSVLGSGLGVVSNGAVIGSIAASQTNVTNNGTMMGSSGLAINGLTGMALSVQNGTGGTSQITNTGSIGSTPLTGATMVGADALVVAAYGGGTVVMHNSGTITGRISFASNNSPGQGHTFTNSGIINGSVSMGTNSVNTFNAVTGSSINKAGGNGSAFSIGVDGHTLNIAATGVIDGGAGGDNTLKLQQGAELNGTIAINNYINFNHLKVESGNWTINGASTAQDAILMSNAAAIINSNGSLGIGTISSYGGRIQAGVAGLNISNNVTLYTSGLAVQGATDLKISGTISGDGVLVKNDGGTLTLSGTNTYTGGTSLNGGGLVVGSNTALGAGALNVNVSAALDTSTGVTLGNTVNLANASTLTLGGSNALTLNGVVSGTGGLVKNGAATTTLTGVNTYTGGTTINAGTLALGAGGSLAITGTVNLANTGAIFDLSNATGTQAIAALNGVTGTNVNLGGNILTLTGSGNATYYGTIAGTGGLTLAGTGTQTLNGASIYTGGTNLNSGGLIIGNSFALGSGALNVGGAALLDTNASLTVNNAINLAAGSALTLGSSNALTLQGVISGAGALVKNGLATTTLTGANSYTGGTVIHAGTLALGAGGSLAATGIVTLADAGTTFDLSAATKAQTIGALAGVAGTNVNLGTNALILAGSSNTTYSGTITGNAGLTKSGSGTQTLTGVNTYSGGTTLAGGVLAVFSDDSLGAATSGLIFNGGILAAANNFVTGRAVTFNGNSGGFDVAAGNTLGLTGAVSGTASFTKTGAGILNFDGTGSGFTGTTVVAAGSLIVGSDASHANVMLGGSVTVDTGATLGGHGTIGSGSGSVITVGSGGTIAPGNSIGTTTINGDYVQAAGSTYLAEIMLDGTSDLIRVTGTATINGGTMFVAKASGIYTPGTRYTLLTAAGGVTGRYSVLDQNMPFVDLSLAYGSKDIFLDVARNEVAFPTVGITRNQKAAAAALESLGSSNTLYTVIVSSTDEDTARAGFNALSGEIHASVKSALINESHFVRDAANNRIRSALGDATGSNMPLLGYEAGGAKPVAANSTGTVAWGQAFGAWNSFDSDGNAASMKTSTGGFLTGLDGEIAENVRLGLLAGYSHTSFHVDDRASSGNSDNWHLGLYGGGKWNALRLSGGVAYTWHNIATGHTVAILGFSDSLESDYHAGTLQTFGEAGYRIGTTSGLTFEPFANLAYINLHTNGFNEDGGAAALHVNSGNTNTTFTTLGVHLASAFEMGGIEANARGTVGWRHAFGDTTPLSTQSFTGSNAFTVAGGPIVKDVALIEAGLDINLTKAATLGFTYQGQLGNSAKQNGFKMDLSVKF